MTCRQDGLKVSHYNFWSGTKIPNFGRPWPPTQCWQLPATTEISPRRTSLDPTASYGRSSIGTVESLDFSRTMERQVLWFLALSPICCHPSDLGLRLELQSPLGKAVHFSTSLLSDISCLASCVGLTSPSLDLLHDYVTAQHHNGSIS